MKNNKPWYQSKTIKNALYAYIVAVSGIIYNAWEKETFTKADLGIILGATYTLQKTIEGRKEAIDSIGGKEEAPVTPPEGPINVPDFSEVGLDIHHDSSPSEDPQDPLETIDSHEGDIDVFELAGKLGKYYIVPKQETRVKSQNKDSSLLESSDYGTLLEGTKYPIISYKKEGSNTISVRFEKEPNSKFYLYTPHIELHRPNSTKVDLSDTKPEVINTKKTPFKMGGQTYYLEDPIYLGSNFYWYEATKNAQRTSSDPQVVKNIIEVAKELDKLRSYLGDIPLVVTSWYRDPITNRRVGGASRSSHLTGNSVDIYSPSMNIWELQKRIISYWEKGGVGKGANRGFCHVSTDGWYRVWDY